MRRGTCRVGGLSSKIFQAKIRKFSGETLKFPKMPLLQKIGAAIASCPPAKTLLCRAIRTF